MWEIMVKENANKDLVLLYYNVGLKLIENNKWGSSFIDTLAKDLKMEFPTLKGMSAKIIRFIKILLKFFKKKNPVINN